MKNKKYVSFALAMATAIGTAAFNPDIVNAEENNASEVVAVDEATEAAPEAAAVTGLAGVLVNCGEFRELSQ